MSSDPLRRYARSRPGPANDPHHEPSTAGAPGKHSLNRAGPLDRDGYARVVARATLGQLTERIDRGAAAGVTDGATALDRQAIATLCRRLDQALDALPDDDERVQIVGARDELLARAPDLADEPGGLAVRLAELDGQGADRDTARVEPMRRAVGSGDVIERMERRERYGKVAPGTFQFIVRSFAPFETFGFGFEGDDRGFTTSLDVTSRITQTIDVQPGAKALRGADAWSDRSRGWTYEETSKPRSRVTMQTSGTNQLIRAQVSGSNPITPQAVTPAIDVKTTLVVAREDDLLHVLGILTGDTFPNCEVLVRDASGQVVFLHGFQTGYGGHSGPVLGLPGEGAKAMGSFRADLRLDADGNFVAARMKSGWVSIAEYSEWARRLAAGEPRAARAPGRDDAEVVKASGGPMRPGFDFAPDLRDQTYDGPYRDGPTLRAPYAAPEPTPDNPLRVEEGYPGPIRMPPSPSHEAAASASVAAIDAGAEELVPLHERMRRTEAALVLWRDRVSDWIVGESDWLGTNWTAFLAATANAPQLAGGGWMRTVVSNAVGNAASGIPLGLLEEPLENAIKKRLVAASGALVGTALAPGVGTVLGYVAGVLIETVVSEMIDWLVPVDTESNVIAAQRGVGAAANKTHRHFARARNLAIAGVRGAHGLLRSRLLADGTGDGARELERWAGAEAAHVSAPKPDDDQSLARSLLGEWIRQRAASPTEALDGTSQRQWEAARDTALGQKGLRDQPTLFISQLRGRLANAGVGRDELDRRLAGWMDEDDPARPTAWRADHLHRRFYGVPLNLAVKDLAAFTARFPQHERFTAALRPAFERGDLHLLVWPALQIDDGSCWLANAGYGCRWLDGTDWRDAELPDD